MKSASHAMPSGCRNLVTAAANGTPGQEWQREPVEPGMTWVEIAFADNGPGIPSQMLGVVFEPYISGHTRGTGLGLPVSRAILKRHGGHITLVSNPGEGVLVKILLPAFRR